MAFTCQVCFEQQSQRFALPKLSTGNGDVLRADDCEHPICKTCLASFVVARVQEQLVFKVRCPYLGCTNEIYEQDVTRMGNNGLIDEDISKRFAELRTRDFTARAESLSATLSDLEKTEDYDLILKLWQSTRLCPRCSLVIEKSEGCNSFFCICGHHFHYESAPRIVGNGIRNFGALVIMAQRCGLQLEDAQKYGGTEWKYARAVAWNSLVERTMADIRLSRDDAWELLQDAKEGNSAAREKIRSARDHAAHSDEDYELDFDLWEHNETEELDSIDTNETKAETQQVALQEPDDSIDNLACASKMKIVAAGLRKNAYLKAILTRQNSTSNATV